MLTSKNIIPGLKVWKMNGARRRIRSGSSGTVSPKMAAIESSASVRKSVKKKRNTGDG